MYSFVEAILGVVLTTTSSRSKDYCPKKQLTTQLRDREIDGKPTSPRGKDCCPQNADLFYKEQIKRRPPLNLFSFIFGYYGVLKLNGRY